MGKYYFKKCHGRYAVNVIIAIDKDILLFPESLLYSRDSFAHVFEEGRVVERGKVPIQEMLRLQFIFYVSIYEDLCGKWGYTKRFCERQAEFRISPFNTPDSIQGYIPSSE